ncbi:Na+/H+ antiporter subunit E [Paracidovorax citrulli]|uniref:Multisubunit potassium/proton antiporter, PhaE subunit n=2 Tax=Paracidovorax citrulli TaxID=80869 RepID=A1TSB4_PARC0|nr:Na+/H+ antiporter subunit E [Paracidovorax citrulli]ABM33852.1 multisubunit potassium/proton antiporter, PhaE subunit [Paracidovorax citrulli AAC00-1]ATG94427.1 Na+/H+ antiporter subunit E [Paracidovorax citrulli]MVT28384.1 Na+/H+ antiporter subunit E [Paracidovorax citrulli]MVT38753.1 Na+/H+ antiporter subunit E [Paracidovorax citrulli]PVY63288.1 multisubunit potassium/proton antiporter PhaE subunit [Paracidovorax citrulli]
MMKRLFPAPLLSVALAGMWLLLNHSMSAGHLILAAIVGLAIPLLTRGLRPLPVRVRRPGAILRLALSVMVDTSLSNLNVVRFLAFKSQRRHPPGFVQIPLDLRDANGLAVLAVIVCITPGTSWAELSLDRSVLMLHVLELDSHEAVIGHIKQRYERPLMEIFES